MSKLQRLPAYVMGELLIGWFPPEQRALKLKGGGSNILTTRARLICSPLVTLSRHIPHAIRSEFQFSPFPSAELIGDHKARLFLHRGAAILSIEGKDDQDERLFQIIFYGLGDDAHRITPIRALRI
jgi:hypothetical protein